MADQRNEKIWSCGQEKMLFFSYDMIRGCCANLKTGAAPILGNYGPGGSIDIDQLVTAKRAHLDTVRRGEQPPECQECPSWQAIDWPETADLFNDINIGHLTQCNVNCYYCATNSNTAPVVVSARKAPRLLPVLKEMVEREMIGPDATIRFGGGEPTILPEFEDLVNYFLSVGRRFYMMTSGVKFSPAIANMLRNGRSDNILVISPDAVSRETYRAIKGPDVCDRVWANLARYAEIAPDNLLVKYIVLPENCRETGPFVRRCQEIGARRVAFDIDCNPLLEGVSNSLTDEIVEAIAVLIYEALQREISVEQSGGGMAVWQSEDGLARVNDALQRISAGVPMLKDSSLSRYVGSSTLLTIDPADAVAVPWGRLDDADLIPLDAEPGGMFLREDTATAVHRIEQTQVEVIAGEECTIEVVARPAGRSLLQIELRDDQPGEYTMARYDLGRKLVVNELLMAQNGKAVARGLDDGWVRCLLALTPASSIAVFNVTLLDDEKSPDYAGTGERGVLIRPLHLYQRRPAKAA